MSLDDMDRAHRSDSKDVERMEDLLRGLKYFMAYPPSRCTDRTRGRLVIAMDGLKDDCAHVVASWD